MHENLKLVTYRNLVRETEQTTRQIPETSRLAGSFAQALLEGMQAGLSHEEMIAALTIGHHLGCMSQSVAPDYSFLSSQLDYWEAVYLEAEEHWARRYRGDE